MRVFILRHGIAGAPPRGGRDADRVLTDDGVRRLRAAVPAWSRLVGRVDRLLVSPYRRAQQTAEIAAAAVAAQIETDHGLTPGGDTDQTIDALAALRFEGVGRVLLVTHEPFAGRLVGRLLTGTPSDMPMDVGMMVCVELASPSSLVGDLVFALTQDAAASLA